MSKRSTHLIAKRRPDKYALYEEAVQSPDLEIAFIDRVFRRLKGRSPRLLREDFAASALISAAWVRRHHANFALAIDLDPRPLRYASSHTLAALAPAARTRVRLHRGNVLSPPDLASPASRGFDVVAALNFSYWCFHDRRTLVDYFRAAREQLAPDGILVLDFMGGADCHLETSDRSRRSLKGFGPFTYVWEHAVVEPVSARTVCKIHFEFPSLPPRRGPRTRRPRFAPMRNAFVYDWRLWGVRELCDALSDAGFVRSRVFWEGDDNKGGGNGVFREQTRGTADRSYIGYIVAEKRDRRA
ncbi:MAG: class I SAM-dependent methyltransferase [Phycisphaerales bacterium]